MARGNMVDSVIGVEKFGLLILTPRISVQTFTPYKSFSISKKGMLMGTWGMEAGTLGSWPTKAYWYKDYLTIGMQGYELIKRTEKYLFFKRIQP